MQNGGKAACHHNKESIRVLEKCSFTFEGRLRKHARDKSDTLCYSVLREEWERLSRLCIDIRTMNYDDIPSICRADGDESQKNIDYLKRQLDNQNVSLVMTIQILRYCSQNKTLPTFLFFNII